MLRGQKLEQRRQNLKLDLADLAEVSLDQKQDREDHKRKQAEVRPDLNEDWVDLEQDREGHKQALADQRRE